MFIESTGKNAVNKLDTHAMHVTLFWYNNIF